ncbi:hypothetical protein B0T18DRAFT_50337 [Schizothecium vesticola]|uniref:Essential protein Yae1 N-terminal domain-containing protein n=1 Tax=Schizothecium vesticola TaxID=314040 RepID=A0AA40KDC4_9PEZI|nr:hypothetical protein B0T18DRAFT_50337 [Schizothecium vesticola]
MAMAHDDPFEDLLNLEEKFYQDGYRQGQEDGVKAGRAEGRGLGLEKGYQKFFESGRLFGRAIVWANRLPSAAKPSQQTKGPETAQHALVTATPAQSQETQGHEQYQLPPLPNNPRLEKHITVLYALAETESLSTENTDEAVNDFDDRLKRAQGKAKIIERMVGEVSGKSSHAPESLGPNKTKLDM